MKRRTHNDGFTLIEVLAALIIISLGMLAVIQAVSQTINNANYLREKTIAHWVAMNKLTEVRLGMSTPPGGNSDGDVDMAGTMWHWRMTISATDAATMQRIDIKVAPKSADADASIASISGFYGSAIASVGSRIEWDPNQPRNGFGGSSSSSSASSSPSGAAGGTP
ncbi:MAG: type II secretion system minor pseudopilin GspI [Steroidobacteraceae bacterium]